MAVIDPLEYTTRVTSTLSWQLISIVWILGFLAAVPGTVQLATAGKMSPWFACRSAIISMNKLQLKQTATSNTATPFVNVSSVDYGTSPFFSQHINLSSFIQSIPHTLRYCLAPISIAFCVLPLVILGYMYIRIFWEASKSGRHNRRRYISKFKSICNNILSPYF